MVEKPIGYKRKDLLDALNKALDSLNRSPASRRPSGLQTAARFTLDDFIEGVYRIDPTTGTQYEMYFRTREASAANRSIHHEHSAASGIQHGVTKMLVWRPFAPIQTVQTEMYVPRREKELVYIILPLSGRTATFQGFMDKFVRIALKNDRRVHLTVVYFGDDGLAEARAIMSRVLAQRNSGATSGNLKLLALNETFSRGE